MSSSRHGNERPLAEDGVLDELTAYNSFVEFILRNQDRVFRYWIYKKLFTPYEQQERFSDESQYESCYANFGVVREVIPLPDHDFLLGIAQVFESKSDLQENHAHIDYYKLSEIRLSYYPNEQEDFESDEE